MNRTKIEWVRNGDGSHGYTWNPVTGCLHGCDYCYARRIAHRFGPGERRIEAIKRLAGGAGKCFTLCEPARDKDNRVIPYPYGFAPSLHSYRLSEPYRLKSPSTIFVGSMGDLFGEWVPKDWIVKVRVVMHHDNRHRYLLLTKNPRRYAEFEWPDNVWIGTTVTSQEDANERIPPLLAAEAKHRFVSLEPLRGPVDLARVVYDNMSVIDCLQGLHGWPEPHAKCARLDWVIIGAMTGPNATPIPDGFMRTFWQAKAAGVPAFIKDNVGLACPPQEVP